MGGKAFEGITQRISKEKIQPTLTWLTRNWSGSKIQGGDYMHHLLGSAGKNTDSGDIDLNMNASLYNQEEVARALSELLGADHVKARPGNNQIFTAVPIGGLPSNGYVQVDFMFGDYEWQKFSYFSAAYDEEPPLRRYYWSHDGTKSILKGLYRTELIKALVAYNSDWVLEEDGQMIARVGPTFFHDRGCVWRYRHRPMRQDGTARVQELKELSKDEFMAIYPSATSAKATVITDPKKIKSLIVGDDYKVDDLNTFETTWWAVRRTYDQEAIKLITKIYLERLNSLKVDIPLKIFKDFGLKV
jgi:hypothetical protein